MLHYTREYCVFEAYVHDHDPALTEMGSVFCLVKSAQTDPNSINMFFDTNLSVKRCDLTTFLINDLNLEQYIDS